MLGIRASQGMPEANRFFAALLWSNRIWVFVLDKKLITSESFDRKNGQICFSSVSKQP